MLLFCVSIRLISALWSLSWPVLVSLGLGHMVTPLTISPLVDNVATVWADMYVSITSCDLVSRFLYPVILTYF